MEGSGLDMSTGGCCDSGEGNFRAVRVESDLRLVHSSNEI